MIPVLHGTWLPAAARCFLWGEAPGRSPRRGRQARVPAHPAQLPADALHERLAALPSSSAVPPERELTVWLPSAGQEQVAGDESSRITFRLEAPDDERAPWALSYLLQATDDPSLLVPAAQIWRERGQHFSYLDRRFAHPQEPLLQRRATRQ